MTRRTILGGLLAALITPFALAAPVQAAGEVKVVTSFSILADLVRAVGGERVQVSSIAGPNADMHVFQPTPGTAKELMGADLVVINGLGFEGWVDRLVKASGYKGPLVVASDGIKPLPSSDHHHGHGHSHSHSHDKKGHNHSHGKKEHSHRHGHNHSHGKKEHSHRHGHSHGKDGHNHSHGHSHGPDDPHAWQDVAHVKRYVANIRDALIAADAAGKAQYEAAANAYLAELDALDAEIRKAYAGIPEARRRVITSHDAFAYYGAAYGIRFLAPQGVGGDSEPTARDVANLIRQVKRHNVRAIFVENISNPRVIERIAKETGVKLSGRLYSDALSEEGGSAATYLDMMRHNTRLISTAMRGGES